MPCQKHNLVIITKTTINPLYDMEENFIWNDVLSEWSQVDKFEEDNWVDFIDPEFHLMSQSSAEEDIYKRTSHENAMWYEIKKNIKIIDVEVTLKV